MVLKMPINGKIKALTSSKKPLYTFSNGQKKVLSKGMTFINGQKKILWENKFISLAYIPLAKSFPLLKSVCASKDRVVLCSDSDVAAQFYKINISNPQAIFIEQQTQIGKAVSFSKIDTTSTDYIFYGVNSTNSTTPTHSVYQYKINKENVSFSVIQSSTVNFRAHDAALINNTWHWMYYSSLGPGEQIRTPSGILKTWSPYASNSTNNIQLSYIKYTNSQCIGIYKASATTAYGIGIYSEGNGTFLTSGKTYRDVLVMSDGNIAAAGRDGIAIYSPTGSSLGAWPVLSQCESRIIGEINGHLYCVDAPLPEPNIEVPAVLRVVDKNGNLLYTESLSLRSSQTSTIRGTFQSSLIKVTPYISTTGYLSFVFCDTPFNDATQTLVHISGY